MRLDKKFIFITSLEIETNALADQYEMNERPIIDVAKLGEFGKSKLDEITHGQWRRRSDNAMEMMAGMERSKMFTYFNDDDIAHVTINYEYVPIGYPIGRIMDERIPRFS